MRWVMMKTFEACRLAESLYMIDTYCRKPFWGMCKCVYYVSGQWLAVSALVKMVDVRNNVAS